MHGGRGKIPAAVFALLFVYYLIKIEEVFNYYFRAKTFILYIVIFIYVYETINSPIINRISVFSILNDAIIYICNIYFIWNNNG